MPDVFLSIGSNIEREKHIASALKELEERVGPLTVSSVYESEAVGFEGSSFYNLVVAFSTERPVSEIVTMLSEIESHHGRTRDCKKFSSRTLDLDLILYGDQVLQEGKLALPRDDITRYAFVLEPLAEITPNRKHPILGESYAELWAKFDKTGVKQRRLGSVSDIS
ncbi:2-amino-4-hydroxy-6-hydroxymethyldihydropteridine diphosphokinase [Methylocaldum szegediense]|uniref:2-amino-4-hydroxy-6-hydroxymethyldihydropteridine diphosphokinase n=1 Tax=Methylocaldum szegediense TaxID=73780 RepID=A0ABM9I7M1_9GAMM|nr:2-amino-4-hydroxy-6-hydroxymethyldihydropteridine diphosphokinase [Methylocaldum szegediense]CAI8943338.1 2-amino-4-hydroxy-6-hydroxymethyldihydropteridinediphosphokinase [Methylocaldum szegediense]